MKLVMDTNVLISALIFGGKPRTIFEWIITEKIFRGVISPTLKEELLGVLRKKFVYSPKEIVKISQLISYNFTIIKPTYIPKVITDDPFDNQVLALAEAAQADFIISGDNHLLKLGTGS